MREERGDGTFPPAKEFLFEEGEHGPTAVIDRFLRTQPDARRRWIERLAVTLRFDEDAALTACRAGEDEREAAWERLREFSFLEGRVAGDGWYVLHSHMRNQILETLPAARQEKEHTFWQGYWQGRSVAATDQYAGLAWYHRWHLDPEAALHVWNTSAQRLRQKAAMQKHWELVGWPAPLHSETVINKEVNARMLICHGIELLSASLGNRPRNLREAIACYDLAIEVYTKEVFPQDWAATQNNKGIALSELTDSDYSQNLRSAIACYDLALKVYNYEDFPQQWAITQNNKGDALQNLPDGDRSQNLHAAIAYYDAALKVRTREDFPQHWATTQNSKGCALRNLLDGDRVQNLHAAITCYDAALKVRTREDFPQEWAATQNNKGNTLGDLPDGNRVQNQRSAIACYDLALEVYIREAFPQEWAMTQNNKGLTLSDLPDGNHAQNLRSAIACYDLALEVYIREVFPQNWAISHFNKCLIFVDLKDWNGALQEVEMAVAGYRQVGHGFYLQRAEELKQDILDAMSADDEPPAA